ncbi:MAG: alpha/beta hydrolase [Betaproteobacteria bacterium]|nr:alpha/beta hydrolase [Betaproteobacteria bacterium]
MYQVKRHPRSSFVPLRHLQYHVREWGTPRPDVVPLFMMHGWMDMGASFQFVIDAFEADRHIIAPDWRGYGLTHPGQVDSFWFPDYLADLDGLIDHFQPEGQIDLVGHSMGGNVVMQYAGIRPTRIRRLINLEGFGLATTKPEEAPNRYAKWMDEMKALRAGDMSLRSYPSASAVARRLMKTNPRLEADKAEWLAQHWARANAQGEWDILGHPAHKVTYANLFRVDEVLAMYQRISAPVLNVEASDNSLETWWNGRYTLDEYHERIKLVKRVHTVVIQHAGHMMHHDQPGELARQMEAFLNSA